MNTIWKFLTGSQYMPTFKCVHGDWTMLGPFLFVTFLIVAGYLLIARDWFRHAKHAPASAGKTAGTNMMWIFLFCLFNGYVMQAVRIFIPIWWPTILLMAIQVIVTWRYVFAASTLSVVFRDIDHGRRIKEKIGAIVDHEQSLPDAALPTNASEIRILLQRIKGSTMRTQASMDVFSMEELNAVQAT